jgi:hypothetical protein
VYTTLLTSNFIGRNNWDQRVWVGQIDEFRIYSRLLSDAEVTTVYNYAGESALLPAACADATPTCASQSKTKRCTPSGTAACCSAGYYFIEGTSTACQPCPAGTYSTDGSATACTACAPDTYSASTGATAASACVACQAGAGAAAGSTYCVPGQGLYPDTTSTTITHGGSPATASFVPGTTRQYFAFTATSGTNSIVFPSAVTPLVLLVGGGGEIMDFKFL